MLLRSAVLPLLHVVRAGIFRIPLKSFIEPVTLKCSRVQQLALINEEAPAAGLTSLLLVRIVLYHQHPNTRGRKGDVAISSPGAKEIVRLRCETVQITHLAFRFAGQNQSAAHVALIFLLEGYSPVLGKGFLQQLLLLTFRYLVVMGVFYVLFCEGGVHSLTLQSFVHIYSASDGDNDCIEKYRCPVERRFASLHALRQLSRTGFVFGFTSHLTFLEFLCCLCIAAGFASSTTAATASASSSALAQSYAEEENQERSYQQFRIHNYWARSKKMAQ